MQPRRGARDDRDPARPLARLSQTQVAVLRMVALGLSNQQIAERRGTSVRAVQADIPRKPITRPSAVPRVLAGAH